MAGMDEIGVGMPTTEILQRHAVDDGAGLGAQPLLEDLVRIWARYSMHGIKYHGETAGKQRPDGREIEQLFHQRGIVGDGVDHLDDHARCGLEAAGPVEVDRSPDRRFCSDRFPGCACGNARVRLSGAGPPLAALNLMPKSPSGPPGLWLADSTSPPMAPRLRMRLEAAGVDRMPPWPTTTFAKPLAAAMRIGGLDRLAIEKAAIAADDQRRAVAPLEAVEDRLDEILHIMRLPEHRHLPCAGPRCRASGRRRGWSSIVSMLMVFGYSH